MYHYNEPVQDTKGNALAGYFLGIVVPDDANIDGGVEAIIYADDAGTPIIAVSGVANRAKVDTDGMVSLYTVAGEYHVDIYAQDGVTRLKRLLYQPMLSGAQGDAATVTVGTVTTLSAGSSATVTNSGDASNAVLNFGIPQGTAGSGTSFAWGGATGTLSAQTDLQAALDLKANLASPALTGAPTAPTAAFADSSTKIATTAFVYANSATLASPGFTGTPTAPTAAADTNTTQLATTAFVCGQANSNNALIAINGSQNAGSSLKYARADHVHPTDTSRAALASPGFTGTPTAPTAAAATNTTQIATTAFVQTALAGVSDPWTVVKLTADASASSTSLSSTGITVSGPTFLGNKYYEFEAILSVKNNGLSSMTVAFVWPAGVTGSAILSTVNLAGTFVSAGGDSSGTINLLSATNSVFTPVSIRGHFYTGSLAATGSLDIQYKNGTATSYTISKGSVLRYRAL